MKVLITTDLYAAGTNGVIISIRNLIDELKRRGHEVRILTLSETIHSHKDDDNSVYYIRSMPSGVYPETRVPMTLRHPLAKELMDWKPDIIHSQCELGSMPYATWISKHTGAPIVHTSHTMYEQYVSYIGFNKRMGKKLVRSLTNKCLKKVSMVIAPTTKMEQLLRSYSLAKPIRVVPTGISLEQHKQRITPEERNALRQSLGIGDDQPTLVYLGRLGAEKNLEELLDFYKKALSAHPDLRLLIVGGGPVRESLDKKAAALEIQDKVVFAGMVPPADVHKYYQTGDIFACASTSEAQGLTYIEAAANGLPMLCHYDTALDDVIKPGVNGYTYEDEAGFMECLDKMLADPAWRTAAGQESERISAGFDKAVFGDAIEDLYRFVIENKA